MLPRAAHVAGPLEQPRQQREHRRRIALGRRRFAGRQPDLALRHRETRHRVHHQQHVLALVAEVLGDRRSPRRRRAAARAAGLSEVETTTTERFRPSVAEVVLEEAAHLAAAFADQGDDGDVRRRSPAIMPSSVLLPTPLPPNRPMRWPRPHVSSASIARTPVPIGATIGSRASGFSGARLQRVVGDRLERAEAVERAAEAVDDASEQAVADGHGRRAAAGDDHVARADAGGRPERHGQQEAVAEPDDLQRQRRPRPARREFAQSRRPGRAGRSTRRAGRRSARPGP